MSICRGETPTQLARKLHKTPHFVDCIFPCREVCGAKGEAIFQLRKPMRHIGVLVFCFPQQPRRLRKASACASCVVALCGLGMSLHTRGDAVERRNAPRYRSSGTLRVSLLFDFITERLAGLTFRAPRSRRWWQPQWAKRRDRSQRG